MVCANTTNSKYAIQNRKLRGILDIIQKIGSGKNKMGEKTWTRNQAVIFFIVGILVGFILGKLF